MMEISKLVTKYISKSYSNSSLNFLGVLRRSNESIGDYCCTIQLSEIVGNDFAQIVGVLGTIPVALDEVYDSLGVGVAGDKLLLSDIVSEIASTGILIDFKINGSDYAVLSEYFIRWIEKVDFSTPPMLGENTIWDATEELGFATDEELVFDLDTTKSIVKYCRKYFPRKNGPVPVFTSEGCTLCGDCIRNCPLDLIEVKVDEQMVGFVEGGKDLCVSCLSCVMDHYEVQGEIFEEFLTGCIESGSGVIVDLIFGEPEHQFNYEAFRVLLKSIKKTPEYLGKNLPIESSFISKFTSRSSSQEASSVK